MEKNFFDLQFFGEDDPANNGGEPGAGNKPDKTFTQADVDRLVKDRLERERKKYADYDDLKKAKDELEKLKQGELSELEKERQEKETLKAAKAAADAEINELRTGQMKVRLLAAASLPPELADRLKGTTEEEIKADIEEVKKLFKPASIGTPSNPGAPRDESPEDRGKRLAEERNKSKQPAEGVNPWDSK